MAIEAIRGAIIRMLRAQDHNRHEFHSYLAQILAQLTIRETKATDSMGILWDEEKLRFELRYNKQYVEELSNEQRVAMLVHQCFHVVYTHVLFERDNYSNKKLLDIAMDLTVNQNINNLPEEAITLDLVRQVAPNANLEENESVDSYYRKLNDAVDQDGTGGVGQGLAGLEGDDHDGFGSSASQALAKEKLKQMVEAAGTRPGSAPGGFLEAIEELLKPKVNWRRELRRFVGDSVRIDRLSTRKKPNRRLDWDYMGNKVKRGAYVLVAVDTSGSVDQNQLAQFWTELMKMKSYADILVVDIDCSIQQIRKLDRRTEPKFTGRGGTSFQILWDALETKSHKEFRRRPDAIVYFTDGYATWPSTKLKIPTLWVLTQKDVLGRSPFGKEIYLDVDYPNGRAW